MEEESSEREKTHPSSFISDPRLSISRTGARRGRRRGAVIKLKTPTFLARCDDTTTKDVPPPAPSTTAVSLVLYHSTVLGGVRQRRKWAAADAKTSLRSGWVSRPLDWALRLRQRSSSLGLLVGRQ